MDRSDLAVRMKEYERTSKHYLIKHMPVILRIDGKAFHTFTQGMKRPFDDEILLKSMRDTMKYLCENIQGCVLGYTQSDEITLVLIDYKKINSSAWFNNCQSKMESIAASMATIAFNNAFLNNVNKWGENNIPNWGDLGGTNENIDKSLIKLVNVYAKAIKKGAMFDCRAFNIPKEDVCNNLIWRQQDATRNSIQQVGHTYFSDKELYKKNTNAIQDMLMVEKKINWNDYPIHLKRGSCCIKENYCIDKNGKECELEVFSDINDALDYMEDKSIRSRWIIDKEIPIFTQNRDYVESRIIIKE